MITGRLRYASVFGISSVVALLVTPVLFQRHAAALRAQITSIAEPSRRDVSRIRLSHALEVASIRGYVITGAESMAVEYADARASERQAFEHLMAKVPQMSASVRSAAEATRAASERWNAVSEQVARGELTPSAFRTRLSSQQRLYRATLAASIELENAIAELEDQKRQQIQRSERAGVIALAVLTLLATASALVILDVSATLKAEISLARTDPLTTLLNRRGFLEAAALEFRRAARHQNAVTLIYMDVDDFKKINDSLGHEAGDRLLKDVSASIRDAIRDADVAARLGGDEFAILLSETTARVSQDSADRVRAHVLAELSRRGWGVTLSVGAITAPAIATDTATLVHAADELMYGAKRDGKSTMKWRSFETAPA